MVRILQQIGLTTHILLANHRLVFDLFEISDLRRRPISLVDWSCYPSPWSIGLATHILGQLALLLISLLTPFIRPDFFLWWPLQGNLQAAALAIYGDLQRSAAGNFNNMN